MSFLVIVENILESLMRVIKSLAMILFIAIFFTGLAQIICRWVFNNPLAWSEELIRMMFIWVCFFGWAICSQSGDHIKISVIVDKLSKRNQRIIETIDELLIIVFSLLMVIYGIQMTQISWFGKSLSLKFLNFGMIYIACPINNAIVICYSLINLFKIWNNKEEEKKS